MRRNRKLHLGEHVIKLVWRQQVVDGKAQFDGRWDPNISTIFISRDQPPELIMETLIHECLHAVSDEYCLGLTERRVELIAKGLHGILKPYLKSV